MVYLQPPAFDDQARADFERAIPRIRRALNAMDGASSVRRDGDTFQLYLGDDVVVEPVDETVDANGEWYPRGRCDTCGSPCDPETGDCTGTPWHVTAVA